MFWFISENPLVFVLPYLVFLPLVSRTHLYLKDVELPFLERILVIYYHFSLFDFLFSCYPFWVWKCSRYHQFQAFTQGVVFSYHPVVPHVLDSPISSTSAKPYPTGSKAFFTLVLLLLSHDSPCFLYLVELNTMFP